MTLQSVATPRQVIEELLKTERVRSAFRHITSISAALIEEQIRICSIPAPPFGEAVRADYFLDRFKKLGLTNCEIDQEGNCVGLRPGMRKSPLLVISAHLDTVFPAETDFTVRNTRGRLFGPGVADDGCGLVALLALIESLNVAKINTEGSILFVATVGEEGEGNLRGARYLFSRSKWAGKVDAFISFDGPDPERITNGAIGSRRYRVTFRGPGGHSWGNFGAPNPIHAMGRAIARLASFPASGDPRTTFNVGRVAGGTGTNVIPVEVEMDVDLRSESKEHLQQLDAFFRRIVREAVDEENSARRKSEEPMDVSIKLIGDRPIGETPRDAMIIRFAEQATIVMGYAPKFERSSTDSNIPISMGIPAITLGAGGQSGQTHTLDEWYDPRDRDRALKRAMLLALGYVGLSET
jgi:tripeptide aminopeptidase